MGRKWGFHSGKLTCYDLTVDNDLTISGDLTFGDAATDTLTVTGKLDANGDVDLGSGSNTVNIGSGSGDTVNIKESVVLSGKLDFSGISGHASSSGLLMGVGTSANPATTSTANANFVEFRVQHTATSGDNRGIYIRTDFNGAGGGGDGIRSNTVLTAAAGTVHGIHGSISYNTGGSVTGLGVGIRAGLLAADAAMSGGTHAALMTELWANGSSTDVSGVTRMSLMRAVVDGDNTGAGNIDDNAFFIEFGGKMAAGSGNIIDTDITTHTAYGGLRVYIPGVGTKYIALVSD